MPAGIPWEIGLAETQQTLLRNDLRSRIWVQTDGQLKTGRDVAIAAMLGADEMGFSTAPADRDRLHHDARLPPQHLPGRHRHPGPRAAQALRRAPRSTSINYFHFVAEEVRQILAGLGLRTMDELVGRVDLIEADAPSPTGRPGASTSRRSSRCPSVPPGTPLRRVRSQEPVLDDALDWSLIEQAKGALERGERVEIEADVRNVNRCVGGLLSSAIAKQPRRRRPRRGLDPGPLHAARPARASAAGSPRASASALNGDANDYAGKGLSGGMLAVQPAGRSRASCPSRT